MSIKKPYLSSDEITGLLHMSAGFSRRDFAERIQGFISAKLDAHKQRVDELCKAAIQQTKNNVSATNSTFKSPVDFDTIHAAMAKVYGAPVQDGGAVSEVPKLTTPAMDSMAEKFKDEPTLSVQRAVELAVHEMYRKVLDRKDAEFVSLQKDLETMRAKNNELNEKVDDMSDEIRRINLQKSNIELQIELMREKNVGLKNELKNVTHHNVTVRIECAALQDEKVQHLNELKTVKVQRDMLSEKLAGVKQDLLSMTNDRDCLIEQTEKMKTEHQGLLAKHYHDNGVIINLKEKVASMSMREVASAEVKEVDVRLTTETTPDGNRYLRVIAGGEGVSFRL